MSLKIAVVTPYYQESPEILDTCLASVRNQTYPEIQHYLIADGFPKSLGSGIRHIVLDAAHKDTGNLARCIGSMAAAADGVDAIAYLDADNWYNPRHIAGLVQLHEETGAEVCTSNRTVHHLDGSLLYRERFDESFVDTSCLCLFRSAFDLLPLWGSMPRDFGALGDRVMWQAILDRGVSRAHSPAETVSFRSQYISMYRRMGIEPPPGAKENVNTAPLRIMPVTERTAMLLGLGDSQHHQNESEKSKLQEKNREINVSSGQNKISLLVPDDPGMRFVADEIFKRKCYKPVKGVPAPRAILDVGANVGLAAAFFRLTYPDAALFCVEPDARVFEFLEINADRIGNCQAYRAGLSHGTYVAPFHFGRSSVLNSSTSAVSDRSVRTLLLDAAKFVSDCPVDTFDLIKIDTEGAEVPILWSLRKTLEKASVVHVEYHSDVGRRIIHELLCDSHYLWQGQVESPHYGVLTYALRGFFSASRANMPLD